MLTSPSGLPPTPSYVWTEMLTQLIFSVAEAAGERHVEKKQLPNVTLLSLSYYFFSSSLLLVRDTWRKTIA